MARAHRHRVADESAASDSGFTLAEVVVAVAVVSTVMAPLTVFFVDVLRMSAYLRGRPPAPSRRCRWTATSG